MHKIAITCLIALLTLVLCPGIALAAPLAGYGTGYVAIIIGLIALLLFMYFISGKVDTFIGWFFVENKTTNERKYYPMFTYLFILLAAWFGYAILEVCENIATYEEYTQVFEVIDAVYPLYFWTIFFLSGLWVVAFLYFVLRVAMEWAGALK